MSSAIPPPWLSSIIQTSDAQQRSAANRNREAAESAERTGDKNFAEKAAEVISNDDADSSVYADAEGAGSQGRAFGGSGEPTGEEAEHPEATEPTDGVGGGLDIEA